MSEAITARAIGISASELHRACMLVIAERLRATIVRTADIMYASAEDFISDLRCVQLSLAGCRRSATRPTAPSRSSSGRLQTFGFHMVEMEFRQHSWSTPAPSPTSASTAAGASAASLRP